MKTLPELPIRIDRLVGRRLALRKGRLLVAEPFMPDPNFKRTVVLLTEYGEEGAVGFILNRPTSYTLSAVLDRLPYKIPEVRLFVGGPVSRNTLHYVHTCGDIPGAVHVVGDVWWGGELEELLRRLASGGVSADEVKFFVGYAGWAPGQLEREYRKDRSWIVVNPARRWIFGEEGEEMWAAVLDASGIVHPLITLIPPEPYLN